MASLLVAIAARRLTGCLVVDDQAGHRSTVFIRQGHPVHVERPDPADRLDRVLVESRILPEGAVTVAEQERALTHRLLGAILVDQGLIEPDKLRQALRLQLQRKLVRLFGARGGQFDLVVGEHPFGSNPAAPGMPIDARALVHPAIRATYDEGRLGDELSPLVGKVVRFTSSADMGLVQTDPALLALLRGPGVLIDDPGVRHATGERAHERKVLLLALHYLGSLEITGVSLPPPESAPVPAPVHLPSTSHVTIVPTSAREVISAPSTGLRPAPAGLFPSPSTGMRPAPAGLFPSPSTGMRPAPAGLATTPAPAAPTQGSTAGPLPRRPDASLAELARREPERVQRTGDSALHDNDLRRAEEAFEALVQAYPGKVRYQACLAWAKCWKAGTPTAEDVSEPLKIFNKAVEAEPQFAMGHYFIGASLKLKNDLVHARKAFEEAVKCDRTLFEAERELRLLHMRGAKR